MKIITTIILFVCYFNVSAQISSLYKEDGKLRVDTTLQIMESDIQSINKVERFILPDLYNNLTIPEIAIENNIQGLMIVKIQIDFNEETLEKSIIKGFDPIMDKLVIKEIDALKDMFIRILQRDYDSEFSFYLPLLFVLYEDEFEYDMKENGALTKKGSLYTRQRVIVN